MDQLPHTFYRRLMLDGQRRHVFHSHGLGRVVRNDDQILVYDFAHDPPHQVRLVDGWGAGNPRARLFAPDAVRAYGRSFWWYSRPLNIHQMFDQAGQLIITRVDFATLARPHPRGVYQTDLYLDCFVGADERQFLVEDEDEAALALQRGLLTASQLALITGELDQVVARIQAGEWHAWLASAAGQDFDHQRLLRPRTHSGYWLAAHDRSWPEEAP